MMIIATLLAFMLTALLILVLRKYGDGLGLMDKPGGHKAHSRPTPIVGGLAIAFGCSFSWLLTYDGDMQVGILILIAALVLLVGLFDDIRGLTSISRFIIHITILLISIYVLDIKLINLGGLFSSQEVLLSFWSIPFTIFAIIGVINAVNMADGIDGLSGIIALIALLSLLVLVLLDHQMELGIIVTAVIGSIVAFLAFNMRIFGRKNASIFMGDSGSTWLGFILAIILVRYSQRAEQIFPPVLALWILALPLYDAVGMLLRRPLRGKSPFAADRSHSHHILLDCGFSVNQVVMSIAGLQLVLVTMAIIAASNGISDSFLFGLFLCGFILYLGLMFYAESRIATSDTHV